MGLTPVEFKVRPWNGKALKGVWEATIKIDGVRAIWGKDGWRSRADKPLYNLPSPRLAMGPDPGETHYELYLGSLRDTVRACRTQKLKEDTPGIHFGHLYMLHPMLDNRLLGATLKDPEPEDIRASMLAAIAGGFEGLVLRQGDKMLKVKPSDTYDVLVKGMEEGEGKHKGRMGHLITSKGNVGTGFTDAEREEWWARPTLSLGTTIEVEAMHLTPDGMFRHPRFIRERFDKIAEE